MNKLLQPPEWNKSAELKCISDANFDGVSAELKPKLIT